MSENYSQQKLHSLHIKSLKNIRNLEISFEGKEITGIFGANGCGKSTIIHALACCFQPSESGSFENYRFSDFFLPTSDSTWSNSELEVTYSYRQGKHEHNRKINSYQKRSKRWTVYARRPYRFVYYFGIENCVPLIELEKKTTQIKFTTTTATEAVLETVLKHASYCLNQEYTAYNIHETQKKKILGVQTKELKYSAFSMSAGEQKVFAILERLIKAENYSLLLIDELDLLLHDLALKKLLEIMSQVAKRKNLQIVFSSHRESILSQSHLVNIRHIHKTQEKTLCFDDTKPDALYRLTGEQKRTLEIFVEDDLATTIVKKIATQMGCSKHVEITRFGAAINCFTTVAGLILSGQSCDTSLFVLDGDEYHLKVDQEDRIKKVLTGDHQSDKDRRESALNKIKCLLLPDDLNSKKMKPEKHLHGLIKGLNQAQLSVEEREVYNAACDITSVDDQHKYIDDLIERLDFERPVGLSKVVDLVSKHNQWEDYIRDVKEWLINKKTLILENENAQNSSSS